MSKLKILFYGDSVTDGSRDKRDLHQMGNSYPKYASQLISSAHPEMDFEFINLGISGNRTDQLFARLYRDAIEFQPDIISILVGINDVWHRYSHEKVFNTNEQLELNYRCMLKLLKERTNAKIMILCPFLLDCNDKEQVREDLVSVYPIIRKLADEYADVYVPLDKHFEEALKTQPEPKYYSADGVHPNANGAEFIGKLYAEAIEPLLKN